MHRLTLYAADVTATADTDTRTISGLAVPYGGPGLPGGAFRGRPVVFAAGALTRSLEERASKLRLIVDHDHTRAVGRLTAWADQPDGLHTTWKVARTPAGDAVLAEAADGIRDGLSIGADVIRYTERGDTVEVTEARLLEVSLVAFPAFDTARVTDVAAQHDTAHTPGVDPRVLRYRLNLTTWSNA